MSFSSRLIAAARAIESLRPDALFVDPFASLLAGPKAMARHQGADSADNQSVATNTLAAAAAAVPQEPNSSTQQQQDIIQQQQQQTDMQQDEGRQVSRLVLRTVFFDEATLLLTGRPAPRSDTVLAAVAAHIQQHKLPPCRQVVMLGAGMDTRPWRLPLDPQLSWFEVDKADVLAAKQRALQEAGAGFTAAASSAAAADSSKQADSGGSSSSDSSVQHPLRVGQWACASADLQKAGWVRKLQEAGLQADTPTAWAAEGLLYYLEPSTVGAMLKEAASISPAGSMIITNFMTAEGLQLLRAPQSTPTQPAAADAASSSSSASDAQLQPSAAARDRSEQAAPAGGGSSSSSTGGDGGNASPAVPAAAGSSASERVDDSSKQGVSSSGSGAGPQAGAVAGAEKDAKASDGSEGRRTNLTSSFKWGCPDNVEEFFAECGWQLLVRHSVTSCTRAYGWSLQQTPGSRTTRTDSQQVQYVVGVVIK